MNHLIMRQRTYFSFATCGTMASKPLGATETSVMLTKPETLVFHSYPMTKYSVLNTFYIKTVLANKKSIKKVWGQVQKKTSWALEWSDKSYEISIAGGTWETAFYFSRSHFCVVTWMARSLWYWPDQKPMYLLYLHELELTSWALYLEFFCLCHLQQQSFEVLSKGDEVKLAYRHKKITNFQENLLEISKR